MFKSEILVENGIELVKLWSIASDLSLKIAVNIGNTICSILKKNKEYLYFPYELKAYKNISQLAGIPFMHPWANRLEGDFIFIEQNKHHFPKAFQSIIPRDGNNLPLHGLLLKSDKWKTKAIVNHSEGISHIATVEFRDEFELAIFPFEHTMEMKTTLTNNSISIEVLYINDGNKPMPLSSGFHPYFGIDALDTDNLEIKIPFKNVLLSNKLMIPNDGALAKESVFEGFVDDKISLSNIYFDHGFEELDQTKTCSVNQAETNFEVNFGDYEFCQIYAPNKIEKPYICIEPMLAKTNDLNRNKCELLNPQSCIKKSFEILIN